MQAEALTLKRPLPSGDCRVAALLAMTRFYVIPSAAEGSPKVNEVLVIPSAAEGSPDAANVVNQIKHLIQEIIRQSPESTQPFGDCHSRASLAMTQ